MPIVQYGNINTAALIVPDLYVQIVPPQNLVINGVPSNRAGLVGTATWGPIGQPVIVGNHADYQRAFGPIQARKFDMGTCLAVAAQQGAQDFRCVRVTDGTETAALGQFLTGANALLGLVARYTGTTGNTIRATLSAATAGRWRLVIASAILGVEQFDNIPGPVGTTSAAYLAFWEGVLAAVNNGIGNQRGPSQIVVGVHGDATTYIAPVDGQNIALSTGTDGATTIAAAVLVGVDTVPRRGMYALRSQGCALLALADADDSTQWTTIDGFAQGEGMYAIQVGPAGDTIANARTVKASAGLDSYSSKLMLGDWCYWNDPTNGVMRLVSPQGFVIGRLANLSPQNSSLNKPVYGLVGTQKTGLPGGGVSSNYSVAELTQLGQAGIDVLTNPLPGGSFWGARFGHNSSTNATVQGDNYTRLTNFIAATLNASMGRYIGSIINRELFVRSRSTTLGFLGDLLQQGILSTLDGTAPFSVICDLSNNPLTRTSLGYLQQDVQVRYGAILERFIVNLEGGQTVQVARTTLPSGQV